MIVKVILITAIIAVCSSYYCADGICPAREHDIIVVVPNLRISDEGLNDEILKSVIQKLLAWNDDNIDFTLTSDNPAISCKKIAELILRPSYESGYREHQEL
jgi:hypothetical protein